MVTSDVSMGTLILIAFATGIGSGIGTPFGNFLFKKYWEPKLEKAHDAIKNLKPGQIKIPTVNDDKIREMLGKPPLNPPKE